MGVVRGERRGEMRGEMRGEEEGTAALRGESHSGSGGNRRLPMSTHSLCTIVVSWKNSAACIFEMCCSWLGMSQGAGLCMTHHTIAEYV